MLLDMIRITDANFDQVCYGVHKTKTTRSERAMVMTLLRQHEQRNLFDMTGKAGLRMSATTTTSRKSATSSTTKTMRQSLMGTGGTLFAGDHIWPAHHAEREQEEDPLALAMPRLSVQTKFPSNLMTW